MKKHMTRIAAFLMTLVLCVVVLPINAQAASGVRLNKSKVTLYTGGTTTLKVTGTSRKVIWSSNKRSVATVSSKGKVTAKKAGKATITAKVGSKKVTCKVTVKKENVRLNKSKVTLYTGGTTTLKVSGTSRKISWSSSKKSVATVSSKGKITAKKAGKATITAKVGSKKVTCKVTVKKENPKLNKTKVTLYPKGTTTLKVTGTSRKVSWSSGKKSVATVSSRGKVTAKKPGTAVITARVSSKKITCKVTVKEKEQPGTSVSIYWNGEKTVKAAGAVGKVDWETSNKSIVTVESSGNDKAVLTGKKVGTATVTAKAAGKTVKRYNVRVKMKTGALTEREELLAEYAHDKYDEPYIFCTTSELKEIGITRAEDEPKLWITHKKALVMARKLLPGRDIHIVDVDSLEEVVRKENAMEKRGAKYVSMQTMYHNHGDIKKWSVCWIE